MALLCGIQQTVQNIQQLASRYRAVVIFKAIKGFQQTSAFRHPLFIFFIHTKSSNGLEVTLARKGRKRKGPPKTVLAQQKLIPTQIKRNAFHTKHVCTGRKASLRPPIKRNLQADYHNSNACVVCIRGLEKGQSSGRK